MSQLKSLYSNTFYILYNHLSRTIMNSPSSKHPPVPKPKKPSPQYFHAVNSKQFDQKLKRLTVKLSRENICKQHKLIANMNLKLEVSLEYLLKMEELKNLKPEDAIRIIDSVPCLEWVGGQHSIGMTRQYHQHHEEKVGVVVNGNKPATKFQHSHPIPSDNRPRLQLHYPNSDRTIILTGITKPWAQSAIKDFNHSSSQSYTRPNSYKKNPTVYQHLLCEIIGVNEFWIAIEADTVSNALAFKKFIRQRKKAFEERRDFGFKEEKRRVRIVMQKQDFYTLLVDAMTEKKNMQFSKRLVNPNSGLFPTMCLRDNRRTTLYLNQDYQFGLKKINKVLYFPIISNRPQSKQPEQHFATLEQVYSEDRSKTSQFFDSMNCMNDLIEKADQGTQAESLGVGTGVDEDEKKDEVGEDERQEEEKKEEEAMVGDGGEGVKGEKVGWIREDCGKEGEERDVTRKKNEVVQEGKSQRRMQQGQTESQPQQQLGSPPDKQLGSFSDSQKEQVELNQQNNKQQPTSSNRHQLLQPSTQQPSTSTKPPPSTTPSPSTSLDLASTPTPFSLLTVRQPLLPTKLLTFQFSTHTQTQSLSLNYTKLKKLQMEYQKSSSNRFKLAPGIPQQFRQMSYQEMNKKMFWSNLFRSMERNSQKKERGEMGMGGFDD